MNCPRNKVLLLFFLVTLFTPRIGTGEPLLTDTQNKHIVYKMYEGYKKKFPSVQDISPLDAMKLMESDRVIFVDSRKPAEMKVSMLPGVLTKEAFEEDPSKYRGFNIIAYCTISYRSGLFAADMAQKGIPILNLKGGVLAWVFEGGKVYHDGKETKRVHVYGKDWNYLPKDYEPVFFGFLERYF